MKYLIHLRPSEDLKDKLLSYREDIKEDVTSVSSNVLHTTLMRVYSSQEKELVSRLERFSYDAFEACASGLETISDYDSNILVLTLEKKPSIELLHWRVIESLRDLIDHEEATKTSKAYQAMLEMDDVGRMYVYKDYGSPFYAEFYNPHITIARVKQGFEFDKELFKEETWEVDSYYLSRKKDDVWEDLEEFRLEE